MASSGIELATAYVQIVPSAEGIEGKISEVLNSEATSAGTDAGKKLGESMASSIGVALANGAVAIGSAVSKIVGSVIDSATKVSEYGDHIDKMSQKIGISAEAYQKWDYVMQRAGTDVDSLKMGMKALNAAAQSGSDAFQKLGLSQQEIANMSQEQLLEETIKRLASMEEGSERAALATQLLGRAGMDLGPLLNSGTEAIEEQMKMAEEYGMVMSDEAIAASAVFQDSLTTLKGTIEGMKNSVYAEFLPSMTQVTDGLAMVFAGNEEGIELVKEGLQGFIDKFGELLPAVLDVGGEILITLAGAIIEHLPDLIESAVGIVNQLVQTIQDNLPQIIDASIRIIMTLVSGLLNSMPQIISAAIQLMIGLASGIIQGIPQIVAQIPQVISSMINALKSAICQFVQIGVDIMKGLAQGIMNGVSSVVNAISDGIGRAIQKGKEFLGIASPSKLFRDEFGKNMMLGMALGIEANSKAVEDALNDVSHSAVASLHHDIAIDTSRLSSGFGQENRALGGYTQNLYVYAPQELSAAEVARQSKLANQNMILSLNGI